MIILLLGLIAGSIALLAFNIKYYSLRSMKKPPKYIDDNILEFTLQRKQKSVKKYLSDKDRNLK